MWLFKFDRQVVLPPINLKSHALVSGIIIPVISMKHAQHLFLWVPLRQFVALLSCMLFELFNVFLFMLKPFRCAISRYICVEDQTLCDIS
jgi:hypothetical protein